MKGGQKDVEEEDEVGEDTQSDEKNEERVEGTVKEELEKAGRLWKERLAFVSGTILVWGLAILALWPAVSQYQTGMSVDWTTIDPQGVRSGWWMYLVLTALLALAGSAIHIISRGAWLAVLIGVNQDSNATDLGRVFNQLCRTSFQSIFDLSRSMLFPILAIPTILLSGLLDQVLASISSLSSTATSWISGVSAIALVSALVFFLMRRFLSRFRNQPRLSRFASLLMSAFVFSLTWNVVLVSCHTLNLELDKEIYSQSQDDIIEIHVTLGGATSSEDVIDLKLLDSNGTEMDGPSMHMIRQGHYASYVSTSTLSEGRYQVVLRYPHTSFSLSYPYFGSEIRQSQWFVVIQ